MSRRVTKGYWNKKGSDPRRGEGGGRREGGCPRDKGPPRNGRAIFITLFADGPLSTQRILISIRFKGTLYLH